MKLKKDCSREQSFFIICNLCHFDEGEIFARSSTKIGLLEWSYLQRFLLRRNDKIVFFVL